MAELSRLPSNLAVCVAGFRLYVLRFFGCMSRHHLRAICILDALRTGRMQVFNFQFDCIDGVALLRIGRPVRLVEYVRSGEDHEIYADRIRGIHVTRLVK